MLRILLGFLLVTAAQAATPVFNASFDNPQENWAAVRGSAVVDSAVQHEGHKSLRLERDASSKDACVQLAAGLAHNWETLRTQRMGSN